MISSAGLTRVVGCIPTVPQAPCLSVSPYPPDDGFYTLIQALITPYDQALQYYRSRPTPVDGKNALTQLDIDNAEIPFASPPATEIIDGDVIIWRLVTIENQAIRSARSFRAATKNSPKVIASL